MLKAAHILLQVESTIVSEWNLVCERSSLPAMTNSSFMFGVMLGAFFLGSLADAVGRRKTLSVCTAAMVVITLASAASPSFGLYFALRAAIGFFCGGYIIAGYVLMNELIGAGWRSLMGNLFQVSVRVFFHFYSIMQHISFA